MIKLFWEEKLLTIPIVVIALGCLISGILFGSPLGVAIGVVALIILILLSFIAS